MSRGEDAPSRGLIGGSEGRNLDVKTPRDIERTCPPVYGSTYDTCRYSTPSVFSNRNPLPPIYCESRPISPLPPVYPIARPGNANLFFSARLGFIWCVSPLSFRTLPPLRGRPLFPPIVPSSPFSPASCRSFAATILSYVVLFPSLSHALSSSLVPFCISLSLFRHCLSRSLTLFVFLISTAHIPCPRRFPLGNTADTATVAANTIAATPPFLHGVGRRVPALFLSLWLIRYIVYGGSHGGAAVPGASGDIRDK